MEEKGNHRATGRALDVLELIAECSVGMTLTELCEKLNAPKSSMFPILHTLVARNYLSQEPNTMKFRIGSMAFQIGNAYLENFNVMDEVQKELQNIVNVCAETCHFATLFEGDVFYLKKVDSPEPIRMYSMVGRRMPAYGTGLGKALLIDYTGSELRRIYPDGLKPLTSSTITDFAQLEKQLEEIRASGFAYEIEESNEYVRCIAVPLQKNHRTLAAISVAIPTFRYNAEKEQLVKLLLLNAKKRLETVFKSVDVTFTDFV